MLCLAHGLALTLVFAWPASTASATKLQLTASVDGRRGDAAVAAPARKTDKPPAGRW